MKHMKIKQSHLGQDTYRYYCFAVEAMYFFYLFLMIALGRAFAVSSIDLNGFKIYAVEILLFFTFPYIVSQFSKIKDCSKWFLAGIGMFFFMAAVHFIVSLFMQPLKYALRDIVLAGYPLLFVLTFLICRDKKNLKKIVFLIISASVVAVFFARVLLFEIGLVDEAMGELTMAGFYVTQMRIFNSGLYFGLALSFILSFSEYVSQRWLRWTLYLLAAVLLYMLFIAGLRTLWLSVVIFLIFFFCLKQKQFLIQFVKLVPVCFVIFFVMYHIDFNQSQNKKLATLINAKIWAFKIGAVNIVSNLPETEKKGLVAGQNSQVAIFSSKNDRAINGEDRGAFQEKLEQYLNLRDVYSKSGRKRQELDSQWWRYLTWRDAILFGLESPVWGKGFGVYPDYKNWDAKLLRLKRKQGQDVLIVIPVHNDLITVFFKMGFLGLALYLFFNMASFINGIKVLRLCDDIFISNVLVGSLSCFIFWHSVAFFYNVIESPPTNIFLWIILGFIEACIFHIRQDKV